MDSHRMDAFRTADFPSTAPSSTVSLWDLFMGAFLWGTVPGGPPLAGPILAGPIPAAIIRTNSFFLRVALPWVLGALSNFSASKLSPPFPPHF